MKGKLLQPTAASRPSLELQVAEAAVHRQRHDVRALARIGSLRHLGGVRLTRRHLDAAELQRDIERRLDRRLTELERHVELAGVLPLAAKMSGELAHRLRERSHAR